MSKIAQKLCNDVVDPNWKASNDELTLKKSTCKTVHEYSNNHSSKPKRSIIIEKRRVTNKVCSPATDSRRSSIQSKETFLRKRIVDASVNTLVSGPLRCDIDCVTVVRKRDNKDSCKCGQRGRNTTVFPKQIQTLDDNRFRANKACSTCVQMATCGTQVYDKCKYSDLTRNKSSTRNKMTNDYKPTKESRETTSTIEGSHHLTQNKSSNKMINNNKPTYLNNFRGARRWALSQLPIRGPDF